MVSTSTARLFCASRHVQPILLNLAQASRPRRGNGGEGETKFTLSYACGSSMWQSQDAKQELEMFNKETEQWKRGGYGLDALVKDLARCHPECATFWQGGALKLFLTLYMGGVGAGSMWPLP